MPKIVNELVTEQSYANNNTLFDFYCSLSREELNRITYLEVKNDQEYMSLSYEELYDYIKNDMNFDIISDVTIDVVWDAWMIEHKNHNNISDLLLDEWRNNRGGKLNNSACIGEGRYSDIFATA